MEAVPRIAGSNPELIEALEEVLACARDGEMLSFAIAFEVPNQTRFRIVIPPHGSAQNLIAELELVKAQIVIDVLHGEVQSR